MSQRYLPRNRGEAALSTEISQAAADSGESYRVRSGWGRSPAEYPQNWTDERVELLKKLWADGLSASQIATKLGEVTRNAVIGKVHRLGLPGRPATPRIRTARPRSAAISFSRPRAKIAHFPCQDHDARAFDRIARRIPDLEPAPDGQVKLTDLTESMCHWPIGDPMEEGFCFCGRGKPFNGPYCPHHMAIATVPATPRRKSVFQLANLSPRRAK